MKFFDAGAEAEGFIAVGQFATGFIAVGQMASGVIAIGQLARGVIVIGQLALGVLAFGQLAVSLTYGGGMVGLAGIRMRQSLLVYGIAGRGDVWSRARRRPTVEWSRSSPALAAVRVVLGAAVAALVIAVGLSWLPDHLDEPDAPPPPTFAPGTR
jgi:hypothetical protein